MQDMTILLVAINKYFLFSGLFGSTMSSASKNVPEQPHQISHQKWVNAAHSYLQPIDLDSLDKACDQIVHFPFKSEAFSITQSEHNSPRTNTQETNRFSPKGS